MATVLDHTIVPVLDLEETVKFYTTILRFQHEGKSFSFEVIRVNKDLTLDFAREDVAPERHFAFAMDRKRFDAAFRRIKEAGIEYGDGPHNRNNMRGPGKTMGSRGMADAVYFDDPSGHVLEIRTY